MPLKTVIFDFDGTLHDSMLIYPRALRAACQWLVDGGWAEPRELSDELIASFVGLTTEEMWKTFAPDLPDKVWHRAADMVGEKMDELILNGTARLYEGVPEMLDRVKAMGLSLVFLSNCRISYQEAAREAFGLDRWFSGYYNSEEWHNLPKEDIFAQHIAERFEGGYAMVGDRYKDLAVSRVNGFPGVACLYGYGTREELADAEYHAQTPAQVADCIAEIAEDATGESNPE